jgi:hypothetical protein
MRGDLPAHALFDPRQSDSIFSLLRLIPAFKVLQNHR